MILVTARVQVPAEHAARFAEVAGDMCSHSRGEPGCLGYRVYADLEQPEHYVFVEEWAEEQALQAHFAHEHTTEFLRNVSGLLAAPADAVFHTTASARRLQAGRGLVPVD